MKKQYDILIIGGGPIGISCAIEAKKKGLSALILEKGVLVNSIYNFPANMTFFSTSKLLEIGEVPFVSHNDRPTRAEALEYYRRVVENWELEIETFCEVISMENKKGLYNLETSKGIIISKYVIVSTGFYDHARMLAVPGENLTKVKHYYDDAHPYIGKKVVVVGAANSACDIALELFHKNADVTMVIRGKEISPRVKYWIKPNIQNRINEGSIKTYFESEISKIEKDSVLIHTPNNTIQLKNDFVLAMTGYLPNYSLFKALKIPISDSELKEPIHNLSTLETQLPGVYAAGVIKAGLRTSKFFIENTREDSKQIIHSILLKG